MCKCQQNVALCLYDDKGNVEFQHWYSSLGSARAVKSKLSYRFRPGYTWVMWTFDSAGNKLLLSSSRPLKFEWVKQSDLI